jgi:putative flippase GtrA
MSDDLATAPEQTPSQTMRILGGEGFHEFVRYFFASAVALLADIGALTLFTEVLGMPYLFAGALAFLIGLILIYVLSTHWVFSARRLGDPWAEFGLFSLIGIVGLGINELILWTLTGGLGLYVLYSKVVSVVFVFTWNFFARKYILFR